MKNIVVLCIFMCAFIAASALAQQNKVVIVPLSSSKTAVAEWAEGDQHFNLSVTSQTVRSITLNAPSNGIVIVNASGYAHFFSTTDNSSYAFCNVTQGTNVSTTNLIAIGNPSRTTLLDYVPFGATRVFPVNAGSQTFNLVCRAVSSDNNVYIDDSNLNAIFHYKPDVVLPSPLFTINTDNCVDNGDPSHCK